MTIRNRRVAVVIFWRVSATLLICAVYAAAQAVTPTLTTLHTFTGYPDDGASPGGVVIGSGGVLYGTTSSGGSYGPSYRNGYGTVFSLTPPAAPSGSWTEAFYSISRDIGAHPSGVTIGGDGVLYGATQFAAFAIKPPTTPSAPWAAKVISSGSPVITYPNGAMTVGSGGVLYGTSYDGASTYDGYGDVFSVTPPSSPDGSWTTQSMYNFYSWMTGFQPDGYYPAAGVVIGEGGVLYGTTSQSAQDGAMGGAGIVYSLSPPAAAGDAWTETILYWFGTSPGDASIPASAGVVIGSGGVLYGTTTGGGTNTSCGHSYGCGTVYSLTPPTSSSGTWTETVLYSFAGGNDGANPNGVVIGKNGVLYGTTGGGGTAGLGTVFSLTPPASPGVPWTEAVLHSFTGSDGANPTTGVAIGREGALYGTTSSGGTGVCGCGTVFELR